MRGSLKIGRIAGISVEIHYTWLLIFGLVTYFLGTSLSGKAGSEVVVWAVAVATSLVFFGSVLAHELSHSLVANAYTEEMVRRITLFAFGGVAHLKDEPPSGKAELWVAVAGPGMSLALAAVFGGIVVLLRLAPASLDIIRSAFLYLSAINVLLAIFNMIPAFPLDGGRVLRALIWIGTGQFDRATQIAAGAGQVFAWLFMAFGVFQILQGPGTWFSGLWILAIGWMLSSAAQGSLRRLSIERALSGVQVGQIMTTPAVSAGADWSVQRLVYEVILPQRIREVPITWAGQVQGVVNATDVQQVPQQNWPTMSVTQVMSPLSDDRIVPPQEPATKALKVVGAGHGRAYVVNELGVLVGVVSEQDLMQAIQIGMLLPNARVKATKQGPYGTSGSYGYQYPVAPAAPPEAAPARPPLLTPPSVAPTPEPSIEDEDGTTSAQAASKETDSAE